jgi:hypothetical protein
MRYNSFMGLPKDKGPIFRAGSTKNPLHSKCPKRAGFCLTVHPNHRHRKRRFHVAPEALGMGYHDYETPTLYQHSEQTPSPPPDITKEPPIVPLESKELSDLEIVQLPARTGMRFCIWLLAFVIACLCLKPIITLLAMAIRNWPNLH